MDYKPHRVWQKHKVGNASSKYDLNPALFERDIEEKEKKRAELWEKFVLWMQENSVDPETLRTLWLRYYEEFLS